jgi:hypothetical protein
MGNLFLLFEEGLEDLGRTTNKGTVRRALDVETSWGHE